MFNSTKLKNGLLSLGTALSLFAGAASATTIGFDLNQGQVWNSYKTERTYSQDGLNLSITGWTDYNSASIGQAKIGSWDGLGVGKANSPQHAINGDNAGGYSDMLLLSFDQVVNLESLSIGWWLGDTDVSVMAFSGVGAPAIGGLQWSDISSHGWQSAGDYYDVGQAYSTSDVNAPDLTSQYWLVGAWNPTLTPGPIHDSFLGGTNYKGGNDNFKINGLTVSTTTQVPEPGTMALLVTGLFGLTCLRRRPLAKSIAV